MRILVAADGHGGEIYDAAIARALTDEGHTVERFCWKDYFKNYQYADRYPTDGNRFKSIYYRLQNKLTFGPAVVKLNRELVRTAKDFKPEMVFVYRGTHVWPRTLKQLRAAGAVVMGYNNDDPFSGRYPRYFWRHFLRGILQYDHIFSYRWKNLADYRAGGMKRVSLLRSYYLAERNFPSPRVVKRYDCDVIFIGHFEDDGRDRALLALAEAGVNVKLFGTEWQKSKLYGRLLARLGEVKPLYGADYNAALGSARMALVFLSKLNNDTYTRRCFEIPATGTTMVAEYTDDLAENLFAEGVEAVYFRTPAELVAKVQALLLKPKELKAIGEAGRARLLKDGHEVHDRAREILRAYKTLRGRA